MSWQAHVKAHGPLVALADGLWQVTGTEGPLDRNMVVYRLPDGGLWLHSVVALNGEGMRTLEGYGRPAVMVVPNGFHRIDARVYKERYPEIRVLCPAAVRDRVSQVVAVDATCEEALPSLGIGIHVPDGTKPGELAYELDVPGGRALVVADLLFNLLEAPAGFKGFILEHITASIGPLGTSRVFRLMVLQNRDAYCAWLRKMADLSDLRLLCVAHGDAVTADVSDALRAASGRVR